MSSMLHHKPLVSTPRVDSDAIILEFIHQLRSEGASESHISHHPDPVRHFLTWLELHGIAVEVIDGAVIEHFLRHDCDCCADVPAPVRFRPWRKRRSSPKISYLFLNARGRAMSPDGFAYRLDLHVVTAAKSMPSLNDKRITPHVIRHATAMGILHATGDIRSVSLWLGHADVKTTEVYLRASPAEKLEILNANIPPSIRSGAFPGAKNSLMSLLNGN